LQEHRSLEQFKLEHPNVWVKYPVGISTLLTAPPRLEYSPPEVYWIYGPTGTGKTRYVFTKEGYTNIWVSGTSLKWFDGYHGQEVVLVDDFRGDYCKFHELLRYTDGYPISVQIKGSFVNFNPKRMYFTCPVHPRDVYPSLCEEVDQLLRRITRIFFTGDVHAYQSQPQNVVHGTPTVI
jgi:hypothetical protein